MCNSLKTYAMLLIIAILLCVNPVKAQESTFGADMSIMDFTIHRVTPQKETANSIVKPTGGETAINVVKKETQKTVPVKVSEKKEPSLPAHSTTQTPSKAQTKKHHHHYYYYPRSYPTVKVSNKNNVSKPIVESKSVSVAEQKIESQGATKSVESMEKKPVEQKSKQITEKEYVENLNNIIDGKKKVTTSVEESRLNNADYFVRPSMALGMVLFIILVIAWVYSKLGGVVPNSPIFKQFGAINRFKVLATSALGQGKIIQLVEINGKQLVIGSTNNNINLLTEITPEEIERLKATEQQTVPQSETTENNEDPDFFDPEFYTSKYSELYRDYLEKQDK